MPLVFLPDVEALFLWGESSLPRALAELDQAGEAWTTAVIAPAGPRAATGHKLALLDTSAKLATIAAAELRSFPGSIASWTVAASWRWLWSRARIEALELVLGGDSGRLARGRTYARAGRTHDLLVSAGTVAASVTGSSKQPYRISIALAQLPEKAWAEGISGMAAKAQFAAELLARQMPQDIDEVFQAAKVSLFPKQRSDLETDCSCPDWGDPCKHVAATHYVLGEALDRDPFLLFEPSGKEQRASAFGPAQRARWWRGRGRCQLAR